MTSEPIQRCARAKVNLTLHVTGLCPNGYHALDSLVCFAGVGDTITVRAAAQMSLNVSGPMAGNVPTDASNLVLQAAALMGAGDAAHIDLFKVLPAAAGIGGGSADAAASILALAELWDVPIPANLEQLGADVPVCLAPGAVRMQGIGEDISPVPTLPDLWAVLVNPGVEVATPDVFHALECKENAPMPDIPEFTDARDVATWCAAQRNDLEVPAMSCAPVIGDVLDALEPALLARMSGSGATCFGLCASQQAANELASHVQSNHPRWWVKATTLS